MISEASVYLNIADTQPLNQARAFGRLALDWGKSVDEALANITNLVHVLEEHYFKSQTAVGLLSSHRGAESLLHMLNDGFNFRAERGKVLKDLEDLL